jgi:thioredoxin 1
MSIASRRRYSFAYKPNTFHTVTFLLFTAKWCDACKQIEPLFNERSEIFKDKAHFESFDVDEDDNDNIAIQYKIVKIPTIIVIINGKVANCINEHLTNDNLDKIIKTYLSKNYDTSKSGSEPNEPNDLTA